MHSMGHRIQGVAIVAMFVGLSACAPGHPLTWAARLEPGWFLIGGGGPPWSAGFVRPSEPQERGSHRVVVMRVEFEEPRPALSGFARFEVDCENDRSRQLETVLYSQHNLRGVEVARDQVISAWSRAPADLDTFVPYACSDTPADRQAALGKAFVVKDTKHRPMPSRADLDPEP